MNATRAYEIAKDNKPKALREIYELITAAARNGNTSLYIPSTLPSSVYEQLGADGYTVNGDGMVSWEPPTIKNVDQNYKIPSVKTIAWSSLCEDVNEVATKQEADRAVFALAKTVEQSKERFSEIFNEFLGKCNIKADSDAVMKLAKLVKELLDRKS